MKTVTKLTASLVIASSLLGAAYVAQAAEKAGENDATGVQTATISLTDAVNAALVKVPGKASLAEFETDDTSGQALWKVEVVSDQGVVDVEVDATNGAILKQAADTADQDENENEDGEKGGKDKKD
ncbi:MAG: hypothetical protein BWK73_28110 [Thiothrix lacustris]|uniref:PepSY domain-containing protein n=1 Tax=Thiothrix lacustris TaxID=525917 RepID=A0A1Y1QK80_9GAMM|nr:MAG: hypothetical protein BWK73_28110 [Thiothrix lacustris]